MKTILFQGDSITDAGRSRENNDVLGAGYPHLLKAALGFEEAGKYEFKFTVSNPGTAAKTFNFDNLQLYLKNTKK